MAASAAPESSPDAPEAPDSPAAPAVPPLPALPPRASPSALLEHAFISDSETPHTIQATTRFVIGSVLPALFCRLPEAWSSRSAITPTNITLLRRLGAWARSRPVKQRARSIAKSAVALLVASTAGAQPRAKGFALDRFEPADRGSNWFYVESLDPRAAAGVVFDYGNRPLVLYARTGKDVAIVEHQLFAHIGGTFLLTRHLRLALSVPIAVFQAGEPARVSTMVFESDQATTLGDVRVGGDVRLAGEFAGPFTLSAGLRVFAPTGSRESYTGNGATRLVPRFNVAGQSSSIAYAA